MTKPRSAGDDKISPFFNIVNTNVKVNSLSRENLFATTIFSDSDDQEVEITDLPRSEWPIGGYGFFMSTANKTISFSGENNEDFNGNGDSLDLVVTAYTKFIMQRISDKEWFVEVVGGGENNTSLDYTLFNVNSNFNLLAAHKNNMLNSITNSTITCTIPIDTTLSVDEWPIGGWVDLTAAASSPSFNVTADSGVTLNGITGGTLGAVNTRAEARRLLRQNTNNWLLIKFADS